MQVVGHQRFRRRLPVFYVEAFQDLPFALRVGEGDRAVEVFADNDSGERAAVAHGEYPRRKRRGDFFARRQDRVNQFGPITTQPDGRQIGADLTTAAVDAVTHGAARAAQVVKDTLTGGRVT